VCVTILGAGHLMSHWVNHVRCHTQSGVRLKFSIKCECDTNYGPLPQHPHVHPPCNPPYAPVFVRPVPLVCTNGILIASCAPISDLPLEIRAVLKAQICHERSTLMATEYQNGERTAIRSGMSHTQPSEAEITFVCV
jgi:hypothetical protein